MYNQLQGEQIVATITEYSLCKQANLANVATDKTSYSLGRTNDTIT